MGYNVLSGSTSAISVISSGSFVGDGSGLENVEQFPLQNASVTRIPFYKTIDGELGLNANNGFTFDVNANALTVPGLTSSVGINIPNPVSSSLAGLDSYLGLDSNGNLIVTSSAAGNGPANSVQFHDGAGVLSGSSNLTYDGITLNLSGNMTITGSILPSGSAIYSLGSATQRWDQIYLGTGSVHLGPTCTISTNEELGTIVINKHTQISGSGSSGEGLTVTGSVFPAVDSMYDLGSPEKQWRSLYVSSSTIYFGGESLSVRDGSLKFGSGSATKGFHVGYMHLLDHGIVMDPNRIFRLNAFQMAFAGGIAYKRRVVSWDYQILKTDYIVSVQTDTLTSSVTLTLPDASLCINGQSFIIKDEGGNANNRNIIINSTNSDIIDGTTSIILESPFASVNLYTNGIDKFFIY